MFYDGQGQCLSLDLILHSNKCQGTARQWGEVEINSKAALKQSSRTGAHVKTHIQVQQVWKLHPEAEKENWEAVWHVIIYQSMVETWRALIAWRRWGAWWFICMELGGEENFVELLHSSSHNSMGDLGKEALLIFATWSLVNGLTPGRNKGEVLYAGHCMVLAQNETVLVLTNMELHNELYCEGGLQENKSFETTMNFGKNGIFEWNWRIGGVWERLAGIVCHLRIGQWLGALLRTGIVCTECMFAESKVEIVKRKGIMSTKLYCKDSNMILHFFSKEWKQYRETNWEFKYVLDRCNCLQWKENKMNDKIRDGSRKDSTLRRKNLR